MNTGTFTPKIQEILSKGSGPLLIRLLLIGIVCLFIWDSAFSQEHYALDRQLSSNLFLGVILENLNIGLDFSAGVEEDSMATFVLHLGIEPGDWSEVGESMRLESQYGFAGGGLLFVSRNVFNVIPTSIISFEVLKRRIPLSENKGEKFNANYLSFSFEATGYGVPFNLGSSIGVIGIAAKPMIVFKPRSREMNLTLFPHGCIFFTNKLDHNITNITAGLGLLLDLDGVDPMFKIAISRGLWLE